MLRAGPVQRSTGIWLQALTWGTLNFGVLQSSLQNFVITTRVWFTMCHIAKCYTLLQICYAILKVCSNFITMHFNVTGLTFNKWLEFDNKLLHTFFHENQSLIMTYSPMLKIHSRLVCLVTISEMNNLADPQNFWYINSFTLQYCIWCFA